MRILICDDNVDAAETLGALLRLDRHEVRLTFNGEDCIGRALSWRPHVALVDIGLPLADGYAVAQLLRAMQFGHRVLLIAVTGHGSDEDVNRAREAGFDLHFAKPTDTARLLEVVSALEPAGARVPS